MAVPFVAPAEGPVPFRRDRIPLAAHEMADISKQLLIVVDGLLAEQPEQRRAVAQLLAVAEALNPGSVEVSKLAVELLSRNFEPREDPKTVANVCGRMWRAVHWLETPEAGIDGQALAACLKDILVVVDDRHPRAKALRDIGEQARWESWVAPLESYQERKPSRSDDLAKQETSPEKAGDKPDKPAEKARIRMESGVLPVLLWKERKEGMGDWLLSREDIKMKAYIRSEPEESEGDGDGDHVPFESLHVSVGSWGDNEHLAAVAQRVEDGLRARYKELPRGLTMEFRNDALDRSLHSGRRHALGAALAVLADSAISGVECDALVLGVMDENGKFSMPIDLWGLLYPLKDTAGIRLIVPRSAESIVSGFLAYERPDFLLKNEVWMADTLDEVNALSVKNAGAALASVRMKFQEIQQKQGTQDARIYVGNPFVRQRLISLYQEEPRHLSAKLLAIQAAGKRPVTLPRAVAASELGGMVRQLAPLRGRDYISPGSKELGKVYDDAKESIEKMTRYIERTDQDVLEAARRCVLSIRDLDVALRKRGEYWEIENEMRDKKRLFDNAYDDFLKLADQVLESSR